MVQKTLIPQSFNFSTLGMKFTDIALHVISYDIVAARMHRKQASKPHQEIVVAAELQMNKAAKMGSWAKFSR